MYRISVYDYSSEFKTTVHETNDPDEMRECVEDCLNDMVALQLRTVIVSIVSDYSMKKPFWEK